MFLAQIFVLRGFSNVGTNKGYITKNRPWQAFKTFELGVVSALCKTVF